MPSIPHGRVCTCCLQWKDASQFKPVSGSPDKLRSWCKPCTLAGQQRYRDQRVTRTCEQCGIAYECRNAESRFCVPCGTVRRLANIEQGEKMRLTCQFCGVVFPSDRSNKQYCSNACKRKALRDKPSGKLGKTYPHTRRAPTRVCPGCGQTFRAVKDTKRVQQQYCSPPCYLRCRRTSKFEANVMQRLERAGLTIDRQVRHGRWTFDGAIVGTRLLVEADGTFWHSSDEVKARDARKDKWAAMNGFIVLRVPEKEYRSNPVKAIEIILRRCEAEGLTVERAE